MRVIIWVRTVSLILALFLCAGCASQRPPDVWIAPAPDLPMYAFQPDGRGGGCLSADDLQKYDKEQRLLWERLKYLHDLLIVTGAKDVTVH